MRQNLRVFFSDPRFVATGAVFGLSSFLFASWLTRLPEIKEALALSHGDLGLALFCLPTGAFLAMFASGYVSQRWGEGRVTMVAALSFTGLMLLPILATEGITLGISLFLVGGFFGLTDVAMNAVASTLEAKTGKIIMSVCHGFYSLGGMIGALAASLMVGVGVSPFWHMSGSIVLMGLMLVVAIQPQLLSIRSQAASEAHFSWPARALMGLALLAFATMMGEGAIADWSAVYLEDEVQVDAYFTGFGFAGFSLCMTLGRFYGDKLIQQVGNLAIVRWGSALCLVGAGFILLLHPVSVIGGFSLLGLGYSCIIPVLFRAAAQVKGIPAAQGIASVASIGYLGFLMGPVLIGYLAEWTTLQMALGLLAVLSLLSLLLGPLVLRGSD